MDRQEVFAKMDLEIEIKGYETWQDFDRIAQFLKNERNAVLIKKADGPDARICEFRIGDDSVLLIFDDTLGNFLRAEKRESLDKIKVLAKEIESEIIVTVP